MQDKLKFSVVINNTLSHALSIDKRVFCCGLGINDPTGIFGTTLGLNKKYGSKRVFDFPTSENALTGICIGASLNKYIPIMTHQRLDFFLLALDQIINSAAKYHYMYGSQLSVPITIRLIIGRGWGQGPTHSQSLQSLFYHIPGLKVVMPSNPEDAKQLLLNSIFDPNPVIFLEHRWLHNLSGKVSKNYKISKLGGPKVVKKGKDLTVLSSSLLTYEALKLAKLIKKFHNIDIEIIDLRVIKPLIEKNIEKSLQKTKKILFLESGHYTGSVSNDILAKLIYKSNNRNFKSYILSMPDVPVPTSYALTKNFYNDASKIYFKILKIFKIDNQKNAKILAEIHNKFHDIPGDWFEGPF